MPRKLTPVMTIDDIEDDVIYTRAALKADPDAAELAAVTERWLGLVDAARGKQREGRIAAAEASASRVVVNGRLDDACRAFGDDLTLAVRKDRASARFRRFFPDTVGAFTRQRLASQVTAVRAWLGVTGDEALDKHRADLERCVAAAEKALGATAASGQVRGAAQIAREELVEDLTRERDGLEATLMTRAAERRLPRDWPARFFRMESRSPAPEEEPAQEPAPGV